MILITPDSSKDFMGKLLVSEAFDSFLLQEASIITSVTYNIEGRIHKDFFSEEEREGITEEFVSWSTMRSTVFDLIKGRNTPISLKMTLALNTEAMNAVIRKESPEGQSNGLRALVVNIRFENGSVNLITGTSYETFTLEKTWEKVWDDTFTRFLTSKGIEFTLQQ